MPENLYPQLLTVPLINQESFNIEMVRKYYQDIANLKEKYTEKQQKYKNAYNRLLHASPGASTVGVVSGISTIGTAFTVVGLPISASLGVVSTVSTCEGACLLLTSKKYKKKLLKCYELLERITSLATYETLISLSIDDGSVIDAKEFHKLQTLYLQLMAHVRNIDRKMKVETEQNFQKTIMDEITNLKKALEQKQLVVVHVFYLIAYIIRKMDKKFNQIYYSDDGYWRGRSAIQKLAKASGSTKEEAEKWLLKQPLYQIYLPAPKYIPRPNASLSLYAKPNDIHQADILYLPHDKFKKKTYKYALNIVDVARRYKGSYQLTSKNSKEVSQVFQWIYENTPLTYPKTLIIDEGSEFRGDTTKLMDKHDVIIRRSDPSQHHSQGIVERFNRTLADRLFSYQHHKEFDDPSKSNREWVSRLQNVVSALNNEKTRLIGMKPVDAIKQTLVEQEFSQPTKEYEEKLLDVGTKVRYLYEPGELEGYQYKGERRKRSTDPIWSVDVYKIKDRYVQKHQPTLYYLDGGPKRSFVFEELQTILDP